MKSIFDQGLPTPCPSPFNMAAYVMACAPEGGDKIALEIIGKNPDIWTYAKLDRAIGGVATGLRSMNLPKGARVLMRLGNSVEFPIVFLAAIAAGLVPVPTSSMLTTPEVDKICDEISPALIVADTGIALPSTPPCAVIDHAGLAAFHTLPHAPYEMGDPDRLAYIVYTSGTSGKPRAVCHAHRAIWARRMMYDGWYGMDTQDRILHAGAFNWTYTLGTGLMDPWAMGATALIPAPEVTPDQLPRLLRDHQASIFAAAPGVYRQMLKSGAKLDVPNLRHGLSAGEKLSDHIRDTWHDLSGTKVYEAFGMSECSTFISGSPARPAPKHAAGYPQQGRNVAIVKENGAPLPIGAAGIIAISHSDQGLMRGYLSTGWEGKVQNGWFLTGDTGVMDDDGAITYLGRNDDMMNAGGFRVSPIEVERALTDHPDISEAAAVEIQVKQDTTVIAGFYTSHTALDESDIFEYLHSKLARYKTPRLLIKVAALPKGANGKLLRRQLREQYEAEHGNT